ncbi:MAG: HlyD family efflux transporter periplasmic adaptor subunit [Polaromonas sp.]|nr:HlyD family efflux transporter periplasmic adaptor subunit [Polaromonas sp.]
MKNTLTTVQWRRRIALGLLLLLGAWGLFMALRPQPLEVDVGTARRAALRVVLEQEGRTRVRDRYVVTAPVNAYARRLALEVGQAVQRGDTLVELEPLRATALDARSRAEAQARVAAAESSLSAVEQGARAAASQAELAQAELQRVRALRLQGHVSVAAEDRAASEAERSGAAWRSAQFAVATARHEVQAARSLLSYAGSASAAAPLTVRAPVAGRVLKLMHKSEGVVASGQPLLEIGDAAALEVEVDLLSADAVRIQPGTPVVFARWGGEGALAGEVKVIEPAGFTKVSALGVEEQRVWVIVAFTSPAAQWQRLGDGYRVEASFILWERADVLQIPASALFREGDLWFVYGLSQGKAVKREVQVGQRTGLSAQVISGIEAGEQVISHPDDRVREGVRVLSR